MNPLTPLEVAALTAFAVGRTQEAAARDFGSSSRTLRRRLAEATQALGARSAVHAAVLAALDGHISVEDVRAGRLPAVGETGLSKRPAPRHSRRRT